MSLRSAAAFLVLLLATLVPARAEPQEHYIQLNATVTIGADGTVQALEWQNETRLLKMIAARVEPAVRRWTFKPGQLDGVAAPTQTYLTLGFDGVVGADGSMQLRFLSAKTGARNKPALPDYPRAGFYAKATGIVVTIVHFDAQGVPSLRSYEYLGQEEYRDDFVEATKAAIKKSKIELERVGGQPVATTMRIPYVYCINTCPVLPKRENADYRDDTKPVALESAVQLISVSDPLQGS